MLYGFLGLLLLFLVVSAVLFRRRPEDKGYAGEKKVAKQLRRLGADYVVFHDLLLPAEQGKTSQIDHVVVSPYGVFVIETKNYKGYILGTDAGQNWTQVLNKQKFPFYNPVWQNNGHIKALRNLLAALGDVPIVSIVTFGNEAKLEVTASVDVVKFSELVHTIQKHRETVVAPSLAAAIAERLRKADIPGKKARKAHVATIQQGKAERTRKVEQGICPRCGAKLVERSGAYGPFMGCSEYPKCKFVLKQAK